MRVRRVVWGVRSAGGGPDAAPGETDRFPLIRRRSDIQGLRAVAVLLVALNHAGLGFLGGGYIGVDVFFVLSGYLITGLLVTGAQRDGRVSLVDFYARRARRILPAATLTLVTTAVAAYYLLNVVRAKQALIDVIWAAFFAANVRETSTATNYFSQGQPPSPVQHFWSLAVEEQFYIVWPTVLAVVLFGWALVRLAQHRQQTRPQVSERALLRLLGFIVLIVSASLYWSIHQTQSNPTAAYFSTFTRAWELGLGAGLAIAAHRITRLRENVRVAMGWSGLAAIVAAAVLFGASTPFPGAAALLPTIGTALVLAAGVGRREPRAAASRALSVSPMRFIGDRSYTFYLWHWPMLVLINERYGPLPTSTKLLLLLAAFALSMVTYAFYEKPLHRGERSRAPTAADLRPLWLCVPLATIGVAAFYQQKVDSNVHAISQQAVAGSPSVPTSAGAGAAAGRQQQQQQGLDSIYRAERTQTPLPAVLVAAKAADSNAALPAGLNPSPVASSFSADVPRLPPGCVADAGQTTSRICRLGNTRASRTMIVFGDSHAHMWIGAILNMARRNGWTVIPLIRGSCLIQMWAGDRPAPGCAAWFRWALHKDLTMRPNLTLIGSEYQIEGPPIIGLLTKELKTLIHTFRRASQKVILMGDVFGQKISPLDCLLGSHPTMGTCSSKYSPSQIIENNTINDVASAAGAGFINTEGWLCALDQCPIVIGHTVAYFDNSHITQEYASQLSAPFRIAFLRAARSAKP